MPTHDPSLRTPIPPHPDSVPGPDYSAYHLPEPPGVMVSQDEAFTRALGAMYWGGYWTAVYHVSLKNISSTIYIFSADLGLVPKSNSVQTGPGELGE